MRKKKKYYNVDQALTVAAGEQIIVTKVTLIAWIKKNDIGFQPGGKRSKWYIHKDKFDQFIQGQKG